MAKRKKIEVKLEGESPVRGGVAAFLLGGAGLLGLVFFFLPWYGDLRGTVSGLGLILDPSGLAGGADLPKTIAQAREHLSENYMAAGGRWFGVVWLLAAATAAVVGLFEGQARRLLGRGLRDFGSVLVVILMSVGLIQFLAVLNMHVLPNSRFAGMLGGLLMLGAALAGLGWLRALDAEVGETSGDLPGRDWAIWLGGLVVTAVVHYVGVCYVLIQRGPEFIAGGRFLSR